MQKIISSPNQPDALTTRTATLFAESQNGIHRRVDRMFANLMIVQWLAGIATALWISTKTWIGASSQTHWHVWAALLLGGAITSLPVFLAWKQPGRVLTRHVIAVAQMLTSALLIHLTGGRIETHFHIFGSLAFFAFYRDWRVLLTATVVVAADHAVRGIFWPQSAFSVLTNSPWRWIEHAGGVVFEDTFLFISIRQSLNEMFEVAAPRAYLEDVNAGIGRQVAERTAELTNAHHKLQGSEHWIRMILEASPQCVKLIAADGTLLEMNPAGLRLIEADDLEQAIGRNVFDLVTPEDRAVFRELNDAVFQGEPRTAEFAIIGMKGTRRFMETHACPLRDADGGVIAHLAITRDVSERKRVEQELAQAQCALVSASRQAGMAEVATSVLHNVGNVLNSVNVSATLLNESVRKSPQPDLARVVTLLREQGDNLGTFFTSNPRGPKVPLFLAQLADKFGHMRETQLKELESLVKNIGHIKQIVSMQQSFAKVSGVTETLKVEELVEDTLRMNAGSFQKHEVELVREFAADVPAITTDKHKVLQILMNLVRNAKHACEDAKGTEKKVTVPVTHGEGRVRIQVSDNGMGIPAENLNRIFNHGFTTKKEGHGFGLHSGANAAKELGGSLTVQSDGTGKGATFTLELPRPTEPSGVLSGAALRGI